MLAVPVYVPPPESTKNLLVVKVNGELSAKYPALTLISTSSLANKRILFRVNKYLFGTSSPVLGLPATALPIKNHFSLVLKSPSGYATGGVVVVHAPLINVASSEVI